MKINHFIALILLLASSIFALSALANPIHVVAAENFYGEIASELGGPQVQVVNIMTNPNQDPHLFSASPSMAKNIADADIIVYNGVGYDPWMERLLANHTPQQTIMVIAHLVNAKNGANPHLWYNPNVMPLYAKAFTQLLIEKDPANKKFYRQQLQNFNQQYQSLLKHIAVMKKNHQGTSITATEPVFNYMAEALGLTMYGQDLQLSVMNDIAPSPSQIKNFENNLYSHRVRTLIYNDQVSDPLTQRLQQIAARQNIPTVGVSEIQPAGTNYVTWMNNELNKLDYALEKK